MEVDQQELGNCNPLKNLREDKKDKAPTRVETEKNFEKKHQRLLGYAEELRRRYHESCRQLISELRPTHLDEFAEVLMERHKHVLQDRNDLIKEMGEKLVGRLCSSLDTFWEECDVSNQLAALEMLKEQYKSFEGNTWNVFQMDPLQRTLPLRMRFKEARLQYMEKRLAQQKEQLDKLMEINRRERSSIAEMDEARSCLLMNMTHCSKNMEEMNSLATKLSCDVIDFMKDS